MKLFRRPGWQLPLVPAVTFMAVLVGGTVAWWGFPPAALAAQDCSPGAQPRYHTSATNSNGLAFNSYGVKAGGSVGSGTGDLVYGAPGTTCLRVASVWVEDQFGDFAEVGWHTQIGDLGDAQCQPSLSPAHPMVLYTYKGPGIDECHEYGNDTTLVAGHYYVVSVRSMTTELYPYCTSNEWQIIFNGIVLNIPDLGFCVGAGVTNAERIHVADPPNQDQEPAAAHFTAMKYWQTYAVAWTPWASHRCFWGIPGTSPAVYEDPAYNERFPSGSHTENISTAASVSASEDCPNPKP